MNSCELVPWRGGALSAARAVVGCAGSRVRLIVVLLAAVGMQVSAQIALQNAVVTDRGIDARRQANQEALKDLPGGEAGPVRYSLEFSYTVGFSDNVNFSESDAAGDFIQTPAVGV